MAASQPLPEVVTLNDNNENEDARPLDTRRCPRADCAKCMPESMGPVNADTLYANRGDGELVLDDLGSTIQSLWEELKTRPLDIVLSNLARQSEENLVKLIDRCFPDRLTWQQVMDLWDKALDPRKPEVVAGLRLHRFLPGTLGDSNALAKTITERHQYSPNFLIRRDNANMQFGWDLRAFDLEFCETDPEEDFVVQLHPMFRIYPIGTSGKTLHRPGIYTFERAMCVLRCQESIYRGLVRIAKCLAVPDAINKEKDVGISAPALSTWQQELSTAAGSVEARVTTIKDSLSRLRTVSGEIISEVKDHGACLDQAHGCEQPLNAHTVCCHLSVRRHGRLILFGALSQDLQALISRVTMYSYNSPELVHMAMETVERDYVWLLRELVVSNMLDIMIDNADFVANMAVRDQLDRLPPDFWQALREAYSLEWHVLRLYLGQGDLPTLIVLLIQYIADQPGRFHARVSTVVEDLKLIRDVLGAAESLHPSSRKRYHDGDKPQGSVRACVGVTQSIEALQLLAVDMSSPQGNRQEQALRGMLRLTTLSITQRVSAFTGIPNSLREELVALLDCHVPPGTGQDTSSLAKEFQEVGLAETRAERPKPRKYESVLNPFMGALVPSVAIRTESRLRVPGRLDKPLAGTTLQEYRQGISHLLAQPEKGTKLQEASQNTLKQRRHHNAATKVEEEDPPDPGHRSAPQSPVLRPKQPKKLIFTNQRHYSTLAEMMPALTEGGRPGSVDLNDVRRMLTSAPLSFEEAVRGNTYIYSRTAQDGWKAGTISFHGPHSGNSLELHVLDGIRADFRRAFDWTRETFELEKAKAAD